jgi:hypothetical protein
MIWVAISGVLLLLFVAVEGLSLLALAGMLATCLLDPVFTYAAGTVNNDAAGVAAGALALLAWSLSRRIGWSLWLGLGAGVLIGLTKGLFVVAPFALVVAALVQEWRTLTSRSGWWEAGKRNVCVLAQTLGGSAPRGQTCCAATCSSVVIHLNGSSDKPDGASRRALEVTASSPRKSSVGDAHRAGGGRDGFGRSDRQQHEPHVTADLGQAGNRMATVEPSVG